MTSLDNRYIVPLVCPSYIAPDHGSVWFRGQEFRIATNAGIPASESVKITCHEHYKLTQIGSDRPACLPNGQWEVLKYPTVGTRISDLRY